LVRVAAKPEEASAARPNCLALLIGGHIRELEDDALAAILLIFDFSSSRLTVYRRQILERKSAHATNRSGCPLVWLVI